MMMPWKLTVALSMTAAAMLVVPVVSTPLSAAPAATMSAAQPGEAGARIQSGPAGTDVQVAQAHGPVPTAPAGQGTHEAPAGHAPAGDHGKKGHFPPFDSSTFASQLLWLVLSFGLLYLLMSRVALPRIGRILEERHDRIADDLEEAAKHKAESQAAQAAYEKALSEARAKANNIAGDTRNRLAADADVNRKKLEADLAAKLTAAENRIATTKSEALTHVRGIAADTTAAIVSTLIGTAPAKADVEKAVDTALAKKAA